MPLGKMEVGEMELGKLSFNPFQQTAVRMTEMRVFEQLGSAPKERVVKSIECEELIELNYQKRDNLHRGSRCD